MVRNEYRRALIMLRRLERGYSGHVRLEYRATMGNMYFTVEDEQRQGTLYAALIGARRGDYYAAPLGPLQSDSRGQYRLRAAFDPRDISGRNLEEYRLVLVIRVAEDSCAPVLTGNLNGSFNADWAAVGAAACALFNSDVQAESAEATVATEPVAEETAAVEMEETKPENPNEVPEARPEIHIEVRALPFSPENANEQAEVSSSEVIESSDEGKIEATSEPPTVVDAEWPEEIARLKPIFAQGERFTPFDAAGYEFVRAPMPENSGYTDCAIGIRAENGRPNAVCYALPAAYTPEPPPGLEGYVWHGDHASGWWAIFLDAETGEELTAEDN